MVWKKHKRRNWHELWNVSQWDCSYACILGAECHKAEGWIGEPSGKQVWNHRDILDISHPNHIPKSKCTFKICHLTWNAFCHCVLCSVGFIFFLLSILQLRDVCVQNGSVWTQVWWMPPRFLPLQHHWLSTVSVSQPHQLLPPTIRWVAEGYIQLAVCQAT